MSRITEDEAAERYGISPRHNVMPNNECRFRLMDKNGIGYVRTDAGDDGAWQNSHMHARVRETYIVQSGWIAVATLVDGDLYIDLLQEGAIWTSPINVLHNVYMSAGAITHVVKHGSGGADDWLTNHEADLLDQLTRNLSEADILRLSTNKNSTA